MFCNDMGMVRSFTRWAGNSAGLILYAITEALKVEIVSEYEPRYWGYETEEEWEAAETAWQEANAKEEQAFWNEIIKFARGESDKIVTMRRKSVAIEMAEIAKRLIAQSPELLAEDKRADLIEAVETMFRQHLVETSGIPF
jgi:hypothetical protein